MRRLRDIALGARESFWLIPSAALLAAVLLGVALVELDATLDIPLQEHWPRLFGAGAEGARGTLAAIAGSMITVAGVVFSVTVVALSLAASTYSPRVLRTFMHDRPTQIAFGVFVGVFAYCLVVLRTVRADDGADGAFVPSLAVFVALVLALVAVWVLVYFIHHVALIIQAPNILQRIAAETRESIDRLFPDPVGDEADEAEALEPGGAAWRPLPALRSGYIVSVDAGGLLAYARERGAVLRMELAVGEFAVESRPLASLAGGDSDLAGAAKALDRLYTLGSERTAAQDAAFGLQQIVDVATRALSPGVNDPSTACMCVDHLSALLARLAGRRMPSRLRTERGELRVIARAPTFESLLALAMEPLGRYAADKPEVLGRLERAARVIHDAAPAARRPLVRRHLARIERRRSGELVDEHGAEQQGAR